MGMVVLQDLSLELAYDITFEAKISLLIIGIMRQIEKGLDVNK